MLPGKRRPLTPAKRLALSFVLVGLTSLASAWAYLAQWTSFDCVADECVFEARRGLTFPVHTREVMSRRTLAEHPEWLELRVIDSNRGTSEITLRLGDVRGLLDQGWRAPTQAKLEALRAASRTPAVEIHEQVSPHPFGFVALAMLLVICGVLLRTLLSRAVPDAARP